jgi:17beta-estradiol 17-dehydrogenase / very-long-chain 3-oxoacyl-CoA reductase
MILNLVQVTLYVVGLITSLALLTRVFRWVWLYFLRTSSLPKYLHGEPSTWALVTGGSDGIGKALAQELLASGFNVIIHGRNPTKLADVKKGFESLFPNRQIEIVIADAGATGSEAEVVKAVGDRNLTVLVNNVGGTIPPNGHVGICYPLEQLDWQNLEANMYMNAHFPAQLTRLLLPLLKRNQPSLIINIGSFSSWLGVPSLSIYSGAKGFINSWSTALAAELRGSASSKDVEVLLFQTGEVVSGGYPVKEGLATPSSATYAKAMLHKVGCGRRGVCGWWVHSIQQFVIGSLPDSMLVKILLDNDERLRTVGVERAKKLG